MNPILDGKQESNQHGIYTKRASVRVFVKIRSITDIFTTSLCRYVACQILDIHQILEVWQSMLDKVPGLILDVSKIKVCRKASSLFCAQRWDTDSDLEPEAVQTLRFSAHTCSLASTCSMWKSHTYRRLKPQPLEKMFLSVCVMNCRALQDLTWSMGFQQLYPRFVVKSLRIFKGICQSITLAAFILQEGLIW